MIEKYNTAQDLFEAARSAAQETARAAHQRQALEAKRERSGSSIVGGSRGTKADVNGTAASNALVDFEALMDKRLARDQELLSYAAAIIYGEDGRGGVSRLLGSDYADPLFFRYCDARSWAETAAMCHMAVRTVQRHVLTAFETVDAVTFERAIAGEGLAED